MVFMKDSGDHVTGKTGLTLTITGSKNGAAFASISPTVTERGNGWYSLALTTSHTDTAGDFALHVTGTAADPYDEAFEVSAGLPADVTLISGDATAADNFETMLDGTGGKTLSLGKLAISATTGIAVDISTSDVAHAIMISSASNQATIMIQQTGLGGDAININTSGEDGVRISGGGDGNAVTLLGNSGAGVYVLANGGPGMVIQTISGNQNCVVHTPHGTGVGLASTISGNITGNLSGSVGSVTNGVTLANNAVSAAALAADAVAEIAAANAGTGAYAITVTVTDGTDPLQSAIVRVTNGITSIAQTTDASGNASFSLDAATWTVTVTKSGYSFTPTTRTVTGNQAGTLVNDLVMSVVVSTIPDAPEEVTLCRLYGYLETLDGKVAKNCKFTVNLVTPSAIKSDKVVVGRSITIRTNSEGRIFSKVDGEEVLYHELQRNDLMTPNTSSYTIDFPEAGFVDTSMTLSTATKDIASLIS